MNEHLIDVSDIDPAELLASLYNRSGPQGLAFGYDPRPMTIEQARDFIEKQRKRPDGSFYVDYLKGRVMKVDIGHKYIDPRSFDRDNGVGTVYRAVQHLRNMATIRKATSEDNPDASS